ncbi:MAG: cytochrome c [Deltaproteobacteria bacterium]|nr:cytochrome c [Deltaproteobacteria bacterium]
MRIFSPFLFLCFFTFLSTANSAEAVDGHELYLYWCSQCHGMEGKGDGINSTPDMLINPRDHTDAAFMSSRTDKQLEDVIMGGGASVSKSAIMPPWRATLTSEEVRAIIVYLRKLCNCRFEGIISDEKLRKIAPDFK